MCLARCVQYFHWKHHFFSQTHIPTPLCLQSTVHAVHSHCTCVWPDVCSSSTALVPQPESCGWSAGRRSVGRWRHHHGNTPGSSEAVLEDIWSVTESSLSQNKQHIRLYQPVYTEQTAHQTASACYLHRTNSTSNCISLLSTQNKQHIRLYQPV